MNRFLRSIGVSGLLISLLGSLALVLNLGPREIQSNLIAFGVILILGAWLLREDKTPPVSGIQWLLVGDAPPYSEMSVQRLQTQYTWIARRLYRRDTVSYKFDELLGLSNLHGYTTDQLEQSLAECQSELEARGVQIIEESTEGLPSYSFKQSE